MDQTRAPQIGPTLRRHRKSRSLTLEGLAELSGVSKSMLSQIERGRANPTLAVLWSLTRALKLDFADLLKAGAQHSEGEVIEVTSDSHTPEIKSADGLPCSGCAQPTCRRFTRNFNQLIQAGVDPLLTVGQRVNAQYRQRDPADPLGFGDNLSNALSFVIGP